MLQFIGISAHAQPCSNKTHWNQNNRDETCPKRKHTISRNSTDVKKETKWPHAHTRNTLYCYNSFCLPLMKIRESPLLLRLSLATVLVEAQSSVGARPWHGVKTCCDSLIDLFVLAELRPIDDSAVERLIAESANEDGTVTERLLCKSKLHWSTSELGDSAPSSDIRAADTVVRLQCV